METYGNNSEISILTRVGNARPYFTNNLRIVATSYFSSGFVHFLIYLSLGFAGFFNATQGGEFVVNTFAAAPNGQVIYAKRDPIDDERISRFFKIDFLPALEKKRVIFEDPVPIEPEPLAPEPVEPEVVAPEIEDTGPAIIDEDELPDYVRPDIKTYSAVDQEAEYIMFPEIELTDVFNEPFSAWQLFGDFRTGGRPAVIVFCDVSREQGYNDLTHWANMWVSFLAAKGLGELPHVICIGSIIDDPYAHPIEYYEQALKMVFEDYREEINDYTQTFAVTGVIDVHNELLRELSVQLDQNIVDLRKPVLMLVDNWGVIRVMMFGRPVDMSMEEIDKAGHIIREIWEMSDLEYIFFKGIILAMQAEQRKLEEIE